MAKPRRPDPVWLLHGFGLGSGGWAVVAEVGLFLLLLLHSLGFVLLFHHPGSRRHRAKWSLVLLVPLFGPLGYLVRFGMTRGESGAAGEG